MLYLLQDGFNTGVRKSMLLCDMMAHCKPTVFEKHGTWWLDVSPKAGKSTLFFCIMAYCEPTFLKIYTILLHGDG